MLRLLINLTLIGHFLGDFYFQSKDLAEAKNQALDKLLIHGLIYLFLVGLFPMVFFGFVFIWPAVIISLLHLAVDWLKARLSKRSPSSLFESGLLWLDQAAHILIIVVLVNVYYMDSRGPELLLQWQRILEGLNLDLEILISWLLALIIIVRPAMIMVRETLASFTPISKLFPALDEEVRLGEEGSHKTMEIHDQGQENAGAFIGILERLIILIFLALGQYGAVGLVLTAKSIVRYSKLIESPAFSEYYLIGTLLSTLIALVTSALLL